MLALAVSRRAFPAVRSASAAASRMVRRSTATSATSAASAATAGAGAAATAAAAAAASASAHQSFRKADLAAAGPKAGAPHDPKRTAAAVASEPLARSSTEQSYTLPHPLWNNEWVDGVAVTHRPPPGRTEALAHKTIKLIRFNFDLASGFSWLPLNTSRWMKRVIFLESVAGVPGSVAGTLRHLRSLRRFERDHGWIHTLLEEAENERMHLMTFIAIHRPGPFFRGLVWLSQGVFFNFFWAAYLVNPKFCHSLVGYLEEEAVKTYTQLLSEMDRGNLPDLSSRPVPPIAIKYWNMDPSCTMRDLFAVIRADEAHHRDVNHQFSSMKPDEQNPFPAGH